MKNLSFLGACVAVVASVSCIACNPKTMKQAENQTLRTIAERKSVRSYTAQQVSNDTIELILRAGMAAPSSKNRQPWHFIVLDDRAALDSLATQLPYAKMLTQAPHAIVICGDVEASESWYLDCSAATQNILLAVQALGLSAVWTGVYPNDDRVVAVQQELGLPANILPLAVVPFGYGAGTEKPMDKYKAERIRRNKW